MKLLLFGLLAFGFTCTSFADGIQIVNDTDHTIYVKVGLNDGTDCVADSWITVCIASGTTHTQTISAIPFTVRVWKQDGPGCMPIWTTESWQHNLVWTSCALTPVADTIPYSATWHHATLTSWGINIYET